MDEPLKMAQKFENGLEFSSINLVYYIICI